MPQTEEESFQQWLEEGTEALEPEAIAPGEPSAPIESDEEASFQAWLNDEPPQVDPATLSEDARRLVRFGLIEPHAAEAAVSSPNYPDYHPALQDYQNSLLFIDKLY